MKDIVRIRNIDETCYETFPCQHYVTIDIREKPGGKATINKRILMFLPDIVKLAEKLGYYDLKSIKYCIGR